MSQPQNISTNTYPSQENINAPNYDFQENQTNGDDAGAWWQRKNVRITEIDGGEENKFGSSNLPSNERPVQRSWVPPQPPPVAIPESATAMRQPKKAINPTEPMNDDQFLARSNELATDELQRITKISETGGSSVGTTGISGPLPAEIQREENGQYLEA